MSITNSYTHILHNFSMQKYPGFAERLKKALEYKGLQKATQKELGKLWKVSGTMAWNYKNGEKLPSVETGIIIAKSLNVCFEWLMTKRGPMICPIGDKLSDSLDRLPSTKRKQVEEYVNFLIEKAAHND